MQVAIKYQRENPSEILQGMQIKTRKCLLKLKIYHYYRSSSALPTEMAASSYQMAASSYLAYCRPWGPHAA